VGIADNMGGTYGVPCPTLDIGSISFPWAVSVTSSDPTSGSQESRDHQDVTGQSCEDVDSCRADSQAPDTVVATSEMSRNPSVIEDYGNSATRRVGSGDESPSGDADASLPVSSRDDDVSRDVVTSQPKSEIVREPEVVSASSAGRIRFRDAALTIATHLHGLDETVPALDGDVSVQLGSSTTEGDLPDSVPTSTKTVSVSATASNGVSGGRRMLLEDILRARARSQQVGDAAGDGSSGSF